MSFYSGVILEGFANTESAQALKSHFENYHEWCWYHGFGDCDYCRKQYRKLYIPLRIAEKQKELGLPLTRQTEFER